MEPWVVPVVVAVLAVAVIIALIWGSMRRFVIRSGDQEAEVEGPGPGSLDSTDSQFVNSRVKGRGARLGFTRTKSDQSKFDVR